MPSLAARHFASLDRSGVKRRLLSAVPHCCRMAAGLLQVRPGALAAGGLETHWNERVLAVPSGTTRRRQALGWIESGGTMSGATDRCCLFPAASRPVYVSHICGVTLVVFVPD